MVSSALSSDSTPTATATQESAAISSPAPTPTDPATKEVQTYRKNGKHWKAPKTHFKPGPSNPYSLRQKQDAARAATKALEKQMRDEKIAEKAARIAHIKEKREAAEEKARYAALAEKMHKKKVERMRRREKRNKALKER